MSGQDRKATNAVEIFARARPFNKTELEQKGVSVVHHTTNRVVHLKFGVNTKNYSFDRIFGENATQKEVYDGVVAPLISNVIAGYNCTVLCHGQTGSGKSHTLFCENAAQTNTDIILDPQHDSQGLIPKAADRLFTELSQLSLNIEYTIRMSAIEIYKEEVRDLLDDDTQIRIYDDPLVKGSVCLKPLTQTTIYCYRDVHDWLYVIKERQRNLPPTRNGRYHTIVNFLVDLKEITQKGREIVKTGCLQFVDLAGDNGPSSVRTDNGVLNRSSLTFANVIRALHQKQQHVPYKDSKLTRILQKSLGGNTKTSFIFTFSPSSTSWDETVATLELSQMAKTIVNTPQVNINKKQANVLKELDNEILKLKEELSAIRNGTGFYLSREGYQRMTEDSKAKEEKIMELLKSIKALNDHSRDLKFQHYSLENSFEKTHSYIETMKRELEETRGKSQEEEQRLQLLARKEKEICDDAKTLLEFCLKLNKTNEIYHSKYQEKSLAMKNNAQIAEQMVRQAQDCLGRVAETSRRNLSENRGLTEELLSVSKFFGEDFAQELESTREMYQQMQEMKEKCQLNLDNLLTFPEEIRRLHPGDFATVITSLETLKNTIEEKLAYADSFFKQIEERLKELELQIVNNAKFMSDAYASLAESKKYWLAKVEEEENMRKFYESQIKKCELQDQELAKEESQLVELIKFLQKLMESDDGTKQEKLKNDLVEFIDQTCDSLQAQRSLITATVATVEQNEKRMLEQMATAEKKMEEFTHDVTSKVNTYLAGKSSEFRSDLNALVQQGDQLQKSLEATMAKTALYDNNLNSLVEAEQRHNMDVKEIVRNSTSILKKLNEEVNTLGHAGDTPAKKSSILLRNGRLSPTQEDN